MFTIDRYYLIYKKETHPCFAPLRKKLPRYRHPHMRSTAPYVLLVWYLVASACFSSSALSCSRARVRENRLPRIQFGFSSGVTPKVPTVPMKPHDRQRKFEYEPPSPPLSPSPEEKEPQEPPKEAPPELVTSALLGERMRRLIRSRLPIEVPLYREDRPRKPTGVTVIMEKDNVKPGAIVVNIPGHGLREVYFRDKVVWHVRPLWREAEFRFYVLYSVEGSL